jgi:hypothetical protein
MASHHPLSEPREAEILKRDLFGTVSLVPGPEGRTVHRDTRAAPWWTRPLARRLAAREARALAAAAQVPDVPRLVSWDGRVLVRSWLEGRPMHHARPADPAYFRAALALVGRLHAAGVVHNDLAKEPNWLVLPDGRPGLIDFQLAWAPRRRSRLFRVLGREDIRHALKHKRWYCAPALSARQRAILARRAWPSRLWMATGKKLYLFVTRRLLGWADREGAGDRTALASAARPANNVRLATPGNPPMNDTCHAHNRSRPLPEAPKTWGIRLSLPEDDPMRRLLGEDWHEYQWFASQAEREDRLEQLGNHFVYYRASDRPTFVLERVNREPPHDE